MENQTTLESRLFAAQQEFPTIKWDKKVEFKSVKFQYASLPEIIKVVRPILAKHGLAFMHTITGDYLICHLFSPDIPFGRAIQSSVKLPEDKDPRTMGAAITYFRRYTLAALLGIVTDEDNDAPPQEKKRLTKQQFDKAIERILAGESHLIKKIRDTFELSASQANDLLDVEIQIEDL